MPASLIEEYGGDAEVIYYDEVGPDPDKPWLTNRREHVTVAVKCVFLTSKHVKYGLSVDQQSDGDGVASLERRVLIAASALPSAPTVECRLRANGFDWKIVSVVPLSPDGIDVIYTLQVRR